MLKQLLSLTKKESYSLVAGWIAFRALVQKYNLALNKSFKFGHTDTSTLKRK